MLSVPNKRALQRTHAQCASRRSQSLVLHRLSTHSSGTNTMNDDPALCLPPSLSACLSLSASDRHHAVPKCVAHRRMPQCSQAPVHDPVPLLLSVSVSSVCLSSFISVCLPVSLFVCLATGFFLQLQLQTVCARDSHLSAPLKGEAGLRERWRRKRRQRRKGK